MTQPHIVALGGTLRPTSATATALERALAHAAARGARTTLLTGPAIDFPNYEPARAAGHDGICAFVDVLRSADGVIVGSPGYHGTLSGLVKNALDHVELLAQDDRPYFDGMPVGIVATAAGWQAAVATMATLRTVAHALRGWPTPVGVAINTAEPDALDKADGQLRLMAEQMLGFIATTG